MPLASWGPAPKNMGCTNAKPSCVETMMSSAPQVSYNKVLSKLGALHLPLSQGRWAVGSHHQACTFKAAAAGRAASLFDGSDEGYCY